MIGRSEIILKWALYSAAALLCLVVQGLALQHLRVFGVIPFLPPLLVALVAMWEGPLPGGAVFALGLGVWCDLTVAAPIPCFYTLIFPLCALLCGKLAKSYLPAGFACSVPVTVLSFLLTDLFHAVVLSLRGHAAWGAAASLFLRETLLVLPLLLVIYPLFRAVYRKCHIYD